MLTTFILCHVVLNFFFNASNPTKFYTLSLHDALPISPLPNLDGHVRQGDALIDPLTLARALGGATAPIAPCGEVERLTSARRALFSLAGPAKQQALRELAGAEGALALRLFTAAVAALERRAAELVAAGKDRDLFGRRRGLRPEERAPLRRGRGRWRAPARGRGRGGARRGGGGDGLPLGPGMRGGHGGHTVTNA